MFRFPLFFVGCSFLVSLAASASPTNYNPAHYDRVPHFTPDGRLLQVEYAMLAPEHSSPILVCQLDDDTLAMVCVQASGKSVSQDRMVVLDGRCVIAMSGILADNLALLRRAHKEWLNVWEASRK